MMEIPMKRTILVLLMLLATWAAAAETGAHPPQTVDKSPHPLISGNGWWAGVMVILVLGLFLAALGVGIAIRLNPTDEPPPEPTHDDHGHGGHGHGH
jgi:hypothetical protein